VAATRPLRLAPEWDDRFTRMLGVSAAAHMAAIVALLFLPGRGAPRPQPLVAYTVEITDPNALGGRVPPGPPGRDLSGGPPKPPAPEPKGEPAPPAQVAKVPEPKPAPEPAKPPEPKPPEPVARAPEPRPPEPVAKAAAPKPPPELKPEAKKPEPPPQAPAKPEPKPPEPSAQPKAAEGQPEAKPAKPEAEPRPAAPAARAKAGSPTGSEEVPARDAYAAAAERWRARAGKAGGGLGGADAGSGPIGAGGEGKGGGGQLVGLEFLAYRQQVINTIKAKWTNVIGRPGLIVSIRFQIAPDGEVSDIRVAQSSGNPAYDASALRAVQHASPLPPLPTRYVNEFREFVIEFHSEERGGQGTG